MFCDKVRATEVSTGYTIIANSDDVQVQTAKPDQRIYFEKHIAYMLHTCLLI